MIEQLMFLKNNFFRHHENSKFLNIDIEPAPPELELEVEMQCREVLKSNDIDNLKRYCTHLIRKKFDQDYFYGFIVKQID